MDSVNILKIVALLLSISCFTGGETITSVDCPKSKNLIGKVESVRIDPCPAPADGTAEKPCQLKRGKTAMISVDFVPSKDIQKLRARLSYVNGIFDFPFSGMEANACKSLGNATCPLTAGQSYTWSAGVYLAPAYPAGKFPLKLLLTDGPYHRSDQVVCQNFVVALS